MQTFSTGSSTLGVQFERTARKTAVAAVACVGLMLAASQAMAVVVHSGPVSLGIPVTVNGLYLNVVTGANNLPGSTAGSTVPGWDINPWSATGLGFFNPTTPAGGVYAITAPGFAANLAVGAAVGAGTTFGAGTSSNVAQWNFNSADNLLGFRFLNEGNGSIHYGWARLALGSSAIDPSRAVIEYAFESTPGLAIQAGVVPEPGTYALMGLGMAGVLLAARRRRQG